MTDLIFSNINNVLLDNDDDDNDGIVSEDSSKLSGAYVDTSPNHNSLAMATCNAIVVASFDTSSGASASRCVLPTAHILVIISAPRSFSSSPPLYDTPDHTTLPQKQGQQKSSFVTLWLLFNPMQIRSASRPA
ncbi:hypothetical protein CMEL01_16387 [Colletotrichum melonis]|uniref:Uncharacterized protein n=1 Tax=Colletotrichum melonis TaxID=1209925 RepID=A0AAI9UFR9_9PEZI|nr:hypothetical protein CMEL01_16387 [Colletotrichum melonis]